MFVLLRLSSLFLYERSENTKGDLYHAIVDCLFSKLDMYFAMDLWFLPLPKQEVFEEYRELWEGYVEILEEMFDVCSSSTRQSAKGSTDSIS
jgi:hypothetical protein